MIRIGSTNDEPSPQQGPSLYLPRVFPPRDTTEGGTFDCILLTPPSNSSGYDSVPPPPHRYMS